MHCIFKLNILLSFIFVLMCAVNSSAQCLTLGADLSYVNTIQKNNGVYSNENGNAVDPYQFFAEKGCDMVRLRLWHTPENNTDYCGNPIAANNLDDMLIAAHKARDAGMQLMLAIHYGDYFNDPGKQKRPAAWDGISHDVLLDSIYNYTYGVLETLEAQGTLPAIVGIGNETTWGFVDETSSTDGWS